MLTTAFKPNGSLAVHEDPSSYPTNWCYLDFGGEQRLAKWSKNHYCWIGESLLKLESEEFPEGRVAIVDTGAKSLNELRSENKD